MGALLEDGGLAHAEIGGSYPTSITGGTISFWAFKHLRDSTEVDFTIGTTMSTSEMNTSTGIQYPCRKTGAG